MKKTIYIPIKILEECFKKRYEFKQLKFAKKFNVSLGFINKVVKNLKNIGCVEVSRTNFKVVDDSFYVDLSVKEIEGLMHPDASFSGYSTYRFHFNEAPADYSEVYIYIDEEKLKELKKRL